MTRRWSGTRSLNAVDGDGERRSWWFGLVDALSNACCIEACCWWPVLAIVAMGLMVWVVFLVL